ncbi:MAG: hypothetical protein ACTSPL_04305, partial [Candidatus Odinarchaeia archaeon]
IIEIGADRYFVTDMQSGIGKKIFLAPNDIQFTYRGRQVIVSTFELKLGKPKARLTPEFVLKI